VALSDHMKQPGLPVSVGLHVAVLVASLVTFSSPKILPNAVEAVAVEVVDPSQLNEVTKGEKAPQAQPTPRVDREAPKPEQNAPGEAKRQVNNDAVPKQQEATAREERKEQAAVTPPPPPVPVRPPQPPKPPEPPKQAVKPPPAPAQSTEEEDEEAEEIIRQANRRKAEEQRKLEQQRQAEATRRAEEQRQEAQRRETERRQQEEARRQADERRKQEEQRKLAEDARRKAEEQKKAQQEAARKAEEERKKREGEQAARNQQAIDNARRALLASREAPQNSGNTGQQVQRTPAAGAATATGARLSPSDRAALAGMIADQIRSCWSVPGASIPSVLPQVRVALNQDGSLGGTPTLVNSSGDPTFRALADSGMRAIRQCAPFRIPARFAATYSDWRSIVVQLNPAD
jgi:colicin import membrane protein